MIVTQEKLLVCDLARLLAEILRGDEFFEVTAAFSHHVYLFQARYRRLL